MVSVSQPMGLRAKECPLGISVPFDGELRRRPLFGPDGDLLLCLVGTLDYPMSNGAKSITQIYENDGHR